MFSSIKNAIEKLENMERESITLENENVTLIFSRRGADLSIGIKTTEKRSGVGDLMEYIERVVGERKIIYDNKNLENGNYHTTIENYF